VGEDQKQHLELTRDIAQKFNNDFAASIAACGFGDAFFPLPEPLIQGPATRVMSLRDGTKKMSKSDPSDYSRINLADDADAIAQKVRKAKTDPEPLPSEEKGLDGRPEADNLVGIYAALADRPKGAVLALSRELGVEFAARGVRVNALCPGPVNTPLLKELFAKDPERAAKRLVHVPMGRFGEAHEIANAALFLASDESSFVTATSFMADGGLSSAYITPGQVE